MGPDVDLQDGRLVGAGELGEGLSAAAAPLLLGGQFDEFFGGGQVGVVPAFRSRLSPSLPAWSRRSVGSGGAADGGRRLGLASEELLLAEAELGLERGDLLLELGLAGHGAVEHGLVVGGLTPGLELLGQPWADRAGRFQLSTGEPEQWEGEEL